MTLDCLQHLAATEWPADRLELVLVDNASHDGVAARVRAEMPSVRVIESASNRGFAGGCNLGLRDREGTDYFALVNNDAMVSPGWLRPLVTALASDPKIGAACPKILFADRFAEVTVESATHRRGRGDQRPLGVRVSGATVDGVDVWPRAQFVTGFWGPEGDAGEQWTAERATLRVLTPDDAGSHECRLRVAADRPTHVALAAGRHRTDRVAGPEPEWLGLELGESFNVINNVGTLLVDDGYATDRGYLEPDHGQYDTGERRVRLVRRRGRTRRRVPGRRRALRRAPLPVLRGRRALVARPPPRVAVPLRARLGRAPHSRCHQRRRIGTQALLRRTQPSPGRRPARVPGGSDPQRRPLPAGHCVIRAPRHRQPGGARTPTASGARSRARRFVRRLSPTPAGNARLPRENSTLRHAHLGKMR